MSGQDDFEPLRDQAVLQAIARLVGALSDAAMEDGRAIKSLALVVMHPAGHGYRLDVAVAGCDCDGCVKAMADALQDWAARAGAEVVEARPGVLQ